MLRISKLTDYAVVLATHLATTSDSTSVRALAQQTAIPEPTVSKVLKALARDGVVTSRRGVRGGYSLARPPDSITIAEVITALEGPIAVTECTAQDTDECARETHCGVRANWQRINEAVQGALAAITLAEMARNQLQLVTIGRSTG